MEATGRDRSRGARPRATVSTAELADARPVRGDDRRRGARRGPRSADASGRSRSTTAPGANLLEVAPLPAAFSYSSLRDVRALPAAVRVPATSTGSRRADEPVAAFTFGSTAHAAFEAFTKERRERAGPRRAAADARGPRARCSGPSGPPAEFGDQTTEEGYQRRVGTLLDNFWRARSAASAEALARGARLRADARARRRRAAGRHPRPDRPDRPPAVGRHRGHRLQDRPAWSQKGVDESLQLSIYALACRDALGLGTPERVTLYFTEAATRLSTTRTDEQLDAARADDPGAGGADAGGRVRGDAAARPCRWCDYRAMCPERL